jgi:hypothetical protein
MFLMISFVLTFFVLQSHICDTAYIGHPHFPSVKHRYKCRDLCRFRMILCDEVWKCVFKIFICCIRRRINMGNTCYDWVEKLLSFPCFCKRLMFRIYRLFILYGSEIWSLTLREEQKLHVLDNVEPKIFVSKTDEISEQCRILHEEQFTYIRIQTWWQVIDGLARRQLHVYDDVRCST